MKRWVLVVLALVALALLLGSLIPPRPCAGGCNVILVMIDTLSANHIATYGYARDTLPKTTAFFDQGVIFDNATSNSPWTLPSFTGMYFSDIASNVTYAELEDGSRANLPGELRKNGVLIKGSVPPPAFFITDGITRLFRPGELTFQDPDHSSFVLGAQVLSEVATSTKPFFLLVHSFEIHDPYTPTPPYDKLFETSDAYPSVTMDDLLKENAHPIDPAHVTAFELRYDQNMAKVDADIATFLNSIPKETLEHTVVILAADHGEAFGEHGKVWHANSLYQEELHIPLMMLIPHAQSRRVEEPVSLADMAPTILALMHIDIPSAFTGESLLPLITGGTLDPRIIPLVNGYPYYLKPDRTPGEKIPLSIEEAGALGSAHHIIEPSSYGVREGANKAFVIHPLSGNDTTYWFDLENDPAEKTNLASTSTEAIPSDLTHYLEQERLKLMN